MLRKVKDDFFRLSIFLIKKEMFGLKRLFFVFFNIYILCYVDFKNLIFCCSVFYYLVKLYILFLYFKVNIRKIGINVSYKK